MIRRWRRAAERIVQAQAVRRRADHAGGAASPRRVRVRDPLVAPRPSAPLSPVPLSAPPVRLQQAAAGGVGPAQSHDPDLGDRESRMERRRLADRFDPRRVRPISAHRQAVRHRRLVRLRLLRQPFPLLLGPASAPDLHPRGAAHHLRPHQPQDRRTRSRPRHARDRARAPRPPPRPNPHRRQGLRRPPSSRGSSPTTAPDCCAPPSRRNDPDPAPTCSNRSAKSSSRSTTPSKANSTSNATAAGPATESPHEYFNASSPSPPPSGTTTPPTNPSCDRSSPTTTDPQELVI